MSLGLHFYLQSRVDEEGREDTLRRSSMATHTLLNHEVAKLGMEANADLDSGLLVTRMKWLMFGRYVGIT